MDKTSFQTSKKGMFAALAGTVLVAVCCFTPILLVLLGSVGLSAFTPYLDLVPVTGLGDHDCLTIVSLICDGASRQKNNR